MSITRNIQNTLRTIAVENARVRLPKARFVSKSYGSRRSLEFRAFRFGMKEGHMRPIFKILPRHEWVLALEAGVFAGSGIDLKDGYIHFSALDQVRETAQKHFSDQDDLMLFWVDAEKMGELLKWEVSRGGAEFPHLYRSLKIEEVVECVALPQVEGEFQFTPSFFQPNEQTD